MLLQDIKIHGRFTDVIKGVFPETVTELCYSEHSITGAETPEKKGIAPAVVPVDVYCSALRYGLTGDQSAGKNLKEWLNSRSILKLRKRRTVFQC
jgi:hypothetical protein